MYSYDMSMYCYCLAIVIVNGADRIPTAAWMLVEGEARLAADGQLSRAAGVSRGYEIGMGVTTMW